eukprot:Em0005g477a
MACGQWAVGSQGQPSVSVAPGLYDLMVMWTPYRGSPTHYTITLMGAGSVVSSSTNLTSTRFAGLLSDAAFSIAVVSINCAGNATTYVTTGTLPLPPTSIGVEQVPQSITTQLTITWTHVGGSVTQYNIMSSSQGYNVTSSPLVRDSCFELKCSFTQFVETTGVITQQISAVAVGVGVGIGLGMPIIMIFAATIAVMAYWLHRRSRNSMAISGLPVAKNQFASVELRLYAVEWHDRPPGYECSTDELCYIQEFKSDRVLDLEHELNGFACKSNGTAAVFNPKADPPTDSQQWYLHPLSNGHYLVVSKLHGKVLTYQIDEE